MKNISEMRQTIDMLSEQFDEMKQRYDKHAGFKLRLQNNHSNFVSLDKIQKTYLCCPDLGPESLEVSTFPFYHSANFARLVHARCTNCGMTWVPSIDFDLSEYYKNEYAASIQPFRNAAGEFFSEENPFLKSDAYKRMSARAEKHLRLVGDNPNTKLLELGPGVGICLNKSQSKKKFFYELDNSSLKILENEVGAKRMDLSNPKSTVDCVIASHFIEHLYLEDAVHHLSLVLDVLSPKGKFVMEVPYGADQIARLAAGNRANVLFEPHTISFSAIGLYRILTSLNFKVEAMSLDDSFSQLADETKNDLLKKVSILEDANLIFVCSKSS